MEKENLVIGKIYEDSGSQTPEHEFVKYVEKLGADSFKFDRMQRAKSWIVMTGELVESRIKEIE